MADDVHALVGPYALDALDDGEEHDFEQHLALCERCREELAGLREAAAALAYGAPQTVPPPDLKERILAQARAERPNVVPLRRRRRSWTVPLAASAAVAACAAVVLGIWAASLQNSKDPFETVLAKPGSRLVTMGRAGAVAVAPDGSAVLAVAVPSAPRDKTYEAWIIRAGKAKPAGLFSGGAGTSIVEIPRPVHSGSIVAVTLEHKGGSQQPTSKPLAQSEKVTT
jgi:anti-sigma-K factor RskA